MENGVADRRRHADDADFADPLTTERGRLQVWNAN
jgi:hypothetical protein